MPVNWVCLFQTWFRKAGALMIDLVPVYKTFCACYWLGTVEAKVLKLRPHCTHACSDVCCTGEYRNREHVQDAEKSVRFLASCSSCTRWVPRSLVLRFFREIKHTHANNNSE